MSLDAWLTILVICIAFTLLLKGKAADVVMLTAALTLMLLGIITPYEMLSGFANTGLATIAMLLIVAAAMTRSGVLSPFINLMLGRPRNQTISQLRLMFPVAALSSILNNTPVVAMIVPYVQQWARRFNLSSSALLIPLSYAAIVGGTCTLIGTSTNLVINGIYSDTTGNSFQLFELAWIGLPLVLVTIAFIALTGRLLLPKVVHQKQLFADSREYVVEMLVSKNSTLVGKSIENAGLRQLNGVYLVEIIRSGAVIGAVDPHELLKADDRLIFAGNVDAILDLQSINGLALADDQVFKIGEDRGSNIMLEAVISNHYPFLDQSVKVSNFRNHYGAVIIAIYREGDHLKQRLGDVILCPGDVLLLEAPKSFVTYQKRSRDFLLISELSGTKPTSRKQGPIALVILLAMLSAVTLGLVSMFQGVAIAVGLLLITSCISAQEARFSLDLEIIFVIAASMAVGLAFEKTGAADVIAHYLLNWIGTSPYIALTLLFFTTALITALVSNITAAVLMFPVAYAFSEQLGISLQPLAVVLMVAASASFATPIGYQTNLMVYGPGNYCYRDFLKIGIPMTLVVGVTTVILVPLIWPL